MFGLTDNTQRIRLEVNGYVISIIQGGGTYSTNSRTVEVAVWNKETGQYYHPEPDMADDVLGHVDACRLAVIIRHVASLP